MFSFRLGYIIAPLIVLIFYILSEYLIIDLPIKRRNISLERDALDYVPALLINLKNGKSVKTSIKNSSKVIDNDLSKEFNRIITNLKIGLTLEEGLEELSDRIPNIYIKNIILDLKENNKFGNKVVDSVEWQLNAMEANYNENMVYKNKMLPISLCLLCLLFLTIMIFVMFQFMN